MLEREDGMRAIEEILAAVRLGQGNALFVVGEAGLGKTRILEHAIGAATTFARVSSARGDAMEAGLPFGLLEQVRRALAGPELLAHDVATPSAEDIRASIFYRSFAWIDEMARAGPLVVVFDDLHWSDPDSLSLIGYISRRIANLPVALIAGLRPWPPAARELSLDLVGAGHARLERLRPLSEKATHALLSSTVTRPVPAEVARKAYASTSGNPLLLEHLAVAFERSGTLPSPTSPTRIPSSLLLHRFAGLPGEGFACAGAASVLGNRFAPDVAVAVANLDESNAEMALEALSRSGLIRATGVGAAEFTQPLVRQALYDDLPPLTRDELHARAFRLLIERGMEAEAAEHAARGNLAGNAKAVVVLQRAGRTALRAGAVAAALERLERGVALAGAQADGDLLLLFGEALLANGRCDEAVRVYGRILDDEASTSEASMEALRMQGRALFLLGEVSAAMRQFERAAALALAHRPDAALQNLLDLSRAAWLTGGPVAALPAAERALALAREVDDALLTQAEAAWGFIAFVSGDGRGLDAVEAAARPAPATNDAFLLRDLSWSWGTLRNQGRVAKYAERFDEAEVVFRATFSRAEETGTPHALASLGAHYADMLVRQGRLEEASVCLGRLTPIADLAPMAAAFVYVAEAWLLLHEGRLDESEARCAQAEAAATSRGQWLPRLRVWHVRAALLLREGRFEQASRLSGLLESECARLGIREPCLVPWARGAVAAHLACGRMEDARRVLAGLDDCAALLPCRWPRIAAAVGRAAIAEALDDHATAAAEFLAALTLHEEVDLPLERIETGLQWGSYLRRQGRVTEARQALREALWLAEAIGARWLAGLVQGELRVAGGRRRRPGSPSALTAQEQRVAELARAGRSTRHIATQLSLSARTVETHLSRIYAKLGVHSQRELMTRAITATPPDPHKDT